jgi:hypothetical protein
MCGYFLMHHPGTEDAGLISGFPCFFRCFRPEEERYSANLFTFTPESDKPGKHVQTQTSVFLADHHPPVHPAYKL